MLGAVLAREGERPGTVPGHRAQARRDGRSAFVTATRRPPGRSTRAISARPRSRSGTWKSIHAATAQSNEASSNGRSCTSPTTRVDAAASVQARPCAERRRASQPHTRAPVRFAPRAHQARRRPRARGVDGLRARPRTRPRADRGRLRSRTAIAGPRGWTRLRTAPGSARIVDELTASRPRRRSASRPSGTARSARGCGRRGESASWSPPRTRASTPGREHDRPVRPRAARSA